MKTFRFTTTKKLHIATLLPRSEEDKEAFDQYLYDRLVQRLEINPDEEPLEGLLSCHDGIKFEEYIKLKNTEADSRQEALSEEIIAFLLDEPPEDEKLDKIHNYFIDQFTSFGFLFGFLRDDYLEMLRHGENDNFAYYSYSDGFILIISSETTEETAM